MRARAGRNGSHAAAACCGCAASRNPKLGNVSSQRSRSAPCGRGSAPTSSVAPQPAVSSICSSDPATPGIETSRAAWQSPASATSTSASPSSRRRSGGRSRNALKNGCVSLVYRPSSAKAASSTSPGAAADARSGRLVTPVHEAESAAGCPSVTWPPTTGTPSSPAAQAIPSSTLLRVGGIGAHQHVDERQRPAAHRAHVGDVRDHGGGAGAERVGLHERRRDRLAADHEQLAAVRHERRVVAVDAGAEPLDQPDVALALQSGRRPDRLGELLELGHRAPLNQGRRGERRPAGCRHDQRRAVDVRRRAARAGRAGGRGRLAAARRRRPAGARAADGPVGAARRPHRRGQRRRDRPDRGLGAARADGRAGGRRGAGPARRAAAALRAADRVRAGLRPAAARAARGRGVRGLGARPRRRPSGCSSGARSRSSPATNTTTSAR